MSRIAATTLVLFLALPLFAADDPLMTQGLAALNAGDSDKAIELFERLVTKSPNCADCHLRLGDAYGTAAQKASIFGKASLASKCKEQYDKAVQLDPNLLGARFSLIEFYLQAPGFMGGSESKAVEQANEIKKRDSIAGHQAMARIYAYQKKPDLQRSEYLAVTKEQPNSAKAHTIVGMFYSGSDKNYKAAGDEYENAVRLDPNYMPAWFRIGQNAAISGANLPKGEEALRKYIAYTPAKDEPPVYRAYYWLGLVYEKMGRKADAKANFAASLKINATQKDAQEALKRVS